MLDDVGVEAVSKASVIALSESLLEELSSDGRLCSLNFERRILV